MDRPTYWHSQSVNQPLFEDVLWSKPQNRRTAGKLFIIGGNAHSLNAPGVAYQAAAAAGIGTARVLLPASVRKVIGNSFPEGEFAPSNRSGSFSREALGAFLEQADWAEGVLLSGDFGRNSETAILLENFLKDYDGPVVLSRDSLDDFLKEPSVLLGRGNTLLVSDLSRLQKMASASTPSLVIRHSMSLHALVGFLNSWTRECPFAVITHHNNYFVTARAGLVSTTPAAVPKDWETALAAHAATWWIQQPAKPFEAVTTAVYNYLQPAST